MMFEIIKSHFNPTNNKIMSNLQQELIELKQTLHDLESRGYLSSKDRVLLERKVDTGTLNETDLKVFELAVRKYENKVYGYNRKGYHKVSDK